MAAKQTSYHVKLDKDLLTKAQEKVDVPALIRDALAKVVGEEMCPACNQPIKKGRSK